ncbi:MAG: hypothetical protein KA207_02785 [Burkholderiaceae bacterium]|nr:hypothetical protein [Burkholderiaceae bacterium]
MTKNIESRLAAVQAKGAVHLVEIREIQGGYIAQRWAISLRFESIEKVEDWLETFDAKESQHVE